MATKKSKRQKKLSYFYDHEDQEAKDLAYGAQKDACKKRLKSEPQFVDASIGGDWTPEQD